MMKLIISSSELADGGTIPARYTCDGENISPSISWSKAPPGTQSLVLIVDDPDAPVGTWVHWVLFNIPSSLRGLPEKVAPVVGVQGQNDFRNLGYGGPCPPKGKPHRYFFKVYALDINLNLPKAATKANVEKAMQGHILAEGQLIGKYGR